MDLKPSNIMIDKKGKVTIIDFGASKHIEQGKSLTTSMAVGKTVAYCPPEQTQETLKNVGPWTDIYSLGATLYSLLTRKTPPTFDDILDEGNEAFYFPASVSDNLQKLIIWMMKPNRKERPQSIEEVKAFLASGEGLSELERHYGIKVKAMNLVVLCPDYPTYYVAQVPKMDQLIQQIVAICQQHDLGHRLL
jgi:serine/threonine protein kinase